MLMGRLTCCATMLALAISIFSMFETNTINYHNSLTEAERLVQVEFLSTIKSIISYYLLIDEAADSLSIMHGFTNFSSLYYLPRIILKMILKQKNFFAHFVIVFA